MTSKPCPCCGVTAPLTRYAVCQPCAAAVSWDPICTPCLAEQQGYVLDAGMEHEATCEHGQKATR